MCTALAASGTETLVDILVAVLVYLRAKDYTSLRKVIKLDCILSSGNYVDMRNCVIEINLALYWVDICEAPFFTTQVKLLSPLHCY